MDILRILVAIFIGSGIGGCLRYLVGRWMANIHFFNLPWGTLVVNIAGCLLLGIFSAVAERWGWLNDQARLMLTVGLCGGLTTFSTFINENFQLLKGDYMLTMLLYMGISVLVGLFMIYLGYALVKLL